MKNLEKYNATFKRVFEVTGDELEHLEYRSIDTWDSVGHMSLITALEDVFDIMMEVEDIIELNSYKKGIEILSMEKYGVNFSE